MGNLFRYEAWWITSDEEGFGKVGNVAVEIIGVAADLPPQMAKEKGMEHLMDEGWQLEKWKYYWRLVSLL